MCNSEGRVSQVLLYLEEICDPAAASDARPKRSDSASSADDAIPTEDGIATTLDVKVLPTTFRGLFKFCEYL